MARPDANEADLVPGGYVMLQWRAEQWLGQTSACFWSV